MEKRFKGLSLKFLNALPPNLYVAMEKQWEDEERLQESNNPPRPEMSRVEIRTMAMGWENTMATRAAEFRAVGLDALRLMNLPQNPSPFPKSKAPLSSQPFSHSTQLQLQL